MRSLSGELRQSTYESIHFTGWGCPRGTFRALSDAPDLLFVIRHHRWLIILGTLAGVLIGTALYFILAVTDPRYTVAYQFQVIPVTNPLDPTATPGAMTEEELLRFIRRQGLRVTSDQVLDQALKSEKVYNTKWFSRYSAQPKKALRRQIEVSPVAGTEVFAIAMQGSDRQEVTDMVNAIAQTYIDDLQNETSGLQAHALDSLTAAKTRLQSDIATEASGLEDFRNAHDIAAMTNTQTIGLATFSALSAEFIKAQTDLAAARANFDAIKKQVESNTLQLPAELTQYVENDPVIRNLAGTILVLEQERVAALLTSGERSRAIQVIDARIAEIRTQIADERDRLSGEAKLRMQEQAQTLLDLRRSTNRTCVTASPGRSTSCGIWTRTCWSIGREARGWRISGNFWTRSRAG